MHKKVLVGLVLFTAICALYMGLAEGQRSYSSLARSCDTINDTVLIDLAEDAFYFYCWLDDSASGVGYLTTYWNSSVIETCAVHIRPGKDFFTPGRIDSVQFIKADSSDIFCWDILQ